MFDGIVSFFCLHQDCSIEIILITDTLKPDLIEKRGRSRKQTPWPKLVTSG